MTKTDKNLVCFEFFFLISFGLTNFIYPIVYYPTNSYFAIFEMPFNELIISKSTAIAFFAYSCYMLSISQINKEKTVKTKNFFVFDEKQIRTLFFLTLVSFILYVIAGGLTQLQSVYSGDGDIREVGIFSYFNNLLVLFCYLMLMFDFRQKNRRNMVIFMAFVLMFIVLLLMTGSRTQALAFGLILLTSFGLHIRRFRTVEVLVIMAVGVALMSFVALARVSNILEGDWVAEAQGKADFSSSFDLFSDLVTNNRNLYVLIDYADNVEHTYFTGMISDITSPVPGLFRLVSENSDLPVELMTGGALPTYLELGEDSAWGLGTNMVGEAYLAFGLPGVIFFFFVLGWIIRKSRAEMNYNIYAYVIYFLFVSHAVFYPRAPILYNPRNIIWSLLIIFVFMTFKRIGQGKNITEITREKN
jgi:oligosaccharide repeat unit polymerase